MGVRNDSYRQRSNASASVTTGAMRGQYPPGPLPPEPAGRQVEASSRSPVKTKKGHRVAGDLFIFPGSPYPWVLTLCEPGPDSSDGEAGGSPGGRTGLAGNDRIEAGGMDGSRAGGVARNIEAGTVRASGAGQAPSLSGGEPDPPRPADHGRVAPQPVDDYQLTAFTAFCISASSAGAMYSSTVARSA
jgi:hypothetical protein